MVNLICILMGLADIAAGILIFLAFGMNPLTIIFGLMMMGKGAMSFF